jgi:hypothetical protein
MTKFAGNSVTSNTKPRAFIGDLARQFNINLSICSIQQFFVPFPSGDVLSGLPVYTGRLLAGQHPLCMKPFERTHIAACQKKPLLHVMRYFFISQAFWRRRW